MPADEHLLPEEPLPTSDIQRTMLRAPGPEWNPQRRRYIPDQCLLGDWALITAAVTAVSQQSVLMRVSACNEAVSVHEGTGTTPLVY